VINVKKEEDLMGGVRRSKVVTNAYIDGPKIPSDEELDWISVVVFEGADRSGVFRRCHRLPIDDRFGNGLGAYRD
jgi:hypothetical protein